MEIYTSEIIPREKSSFCAKISFRILIPIGKSFQAKTEPCFQKKWSCQKYWVLYFFLFPFFSLFLFFAIFWSRQWELVSTPCQFSFCQKNQPWWIIPNQSHLKPAIDKPAMISMLQDFSKPEFLNFLSH